MRKGGMWRRGVTLTKGREGSGGKRGGGRRGESRVLLGEKDRARERQSQLFACRSFKIIHPAEREREREKSQRRNGRADGASVGKEGGKARRETEQKDKRER